MSSLVYTPLCISQTKKGCEVRFIPCPAETSFYGISPSLLQFKPTGMMTYELFLDKDNIISDIRPEYHVCHKDDENYFHFLAYLVPVPNTIPIYVYRLNNEIIVDKIKPSTEISFVFYAISLPIYTYTFDPETGVSYPSLDGISFVECLQLDLENLKKKYLSRYPNEDRITESLKILILCYTVVFYLLLIKFLIEVFKGSTDTFRQTY